MGTKFGPSADIDWPVLRLYLLLILLAFLALALRLFWLQVVTGSSHRLAGLNNIIRDTQIPGPRGDILDRSGKVLASSKNVYGLLYLQPPDIESYLPTPAERKQLDAAGLRATYLHRETGQSLHELQRLSAYLEIPYLDLLERIEKERHRVYGYQPLPIVDELTQAQVIFIDENKQDFPGIMIERYAFRRVYPLDKATAHLLGYTGYITESDPEPMRRLGYGSLETVGKDGLERSFEKLLHGTPGRRDIRVNRERIFQGVANETAPRQGSDIYLTIDKELQARAGAVLDGRPGAVIISSLSPGHEGEILAFTSGPSFDPNRFGEKDYYASLIFNADGSENQSRPLLNRASGSAFPPGSTFKLVGATAVLQEGLFSQGSGFYCKGYLEIGREKRRFHCHHRSGHGHVTFLEAISKSCDVAFYEMGLRLGADAPATIKRYSALFGYGELTGIELAGESRGTLPDKEWKRQNYAWANEADRLWYTGDTLNYMIGQGYLTATPLQVLWATQLVALDGRCYPPKLLKARLANNQVVQTGHAEPVQRPLSKDALATVRAGMRLTVTDGTASKLNLSGLQVCAKTGTAETGRPGENDHSWVTGFYPKDNPQYAFVVFFQNGGSSSDTAVPAAAQLLKYMRANPPIDAGSAPPPAMADDNDPAESTRVYETE